MKLAAGRYRATGHRGRQGWLLPAAQWSRRRRMWTHSRGLRARHPGFFYSYISLMDVKPICLAFVRVYVSETV